MMICFFLRLSTIRILPRAADHEKKATIEGVWVRYTLFRGNRLPSEQAKELKKDLTLNNPFLEETHHSLSARSLLTIVECNTWKKEAKTSTSQSCAFLTKVTFHWVEPRKIFILSATEASFTRAIPKRTWKVSFRTVSPHYISWQNCVLTPSPTLNLAKPEKGSHHFLMFFHNPTPKAPIGSREHHPPYKQPNLESTATLHQASLSIPNRYNHLPNKAWLNINEFLIPSPPYEIGAQTFDQLTKWCLHSSPIPPHRKSPFNFSMLAATLPRIGNIDK